MLINYISIKQTIGRFIREFGLSELEVIDDIPQWVEDAIAIMGIPNYYVNRHSIAKVTDHRAPVPCGIEVLHGIWTTDSGCEATEPKQLKRLFIRNVPIIGTLIKGEQSGIGYGTINGGYIHTSYEEGYIYVAYKGLPLDCDGFPLVPKDPKVNEALQYYFMYRLALRGYKHPVVDFKTAYQLWEKTYPAASNSINWMDLQDYQEFTEMWTNNLIGDLHANQYIN